jgi:hypothetical protein
MLIWFLLRATDYASTPRRACSVPAPWRRWSAWTKSRSWLAWLNQPTGGDGGEGGGDVVVVVDGEKSAHGRVGGPGGEVVGVEQPAVEIAAVAVGVLSTQVLSASESAAAMGR